MKEKIEKNWDEILNLLENHYDVSRIIIETWIRPLSIYDVKDNVVYLYVDEKRGKHGVDYLRNKGYDIYLLSSIREFFENSEIDLVIDEKNKIVASIDGESSEETEPEDKPYSDAYYAAIKRGNLNPKYTFENFIVGESNKHAHATCTAVADLPSQDNFNPLFLYGGSGLGKTHLIQSIAHYILQHDENAKVLYVTSETFTNEIIDAIKQNKTDEFRAKYRQVDVLIIDDIQTIIGKERTQEEFFNTFNFLYEAKKQIIISSDRPPREIKQLDERLRSRFEWGVPIDIHAPDYETRMAILKNKADSKLSNEKVTVDLAKETLKDLISKDTNVTVTPEIILNVVAEHMGVSIPDITSTKRSKDIALARQTVMYLSRDLTDKSLQAIGEVVGGKDHATVYNGIKRVEEKMKKDDSFAATINVIINKINPEQK